MPARFETYLSSPSEAAERRFVLVVYQEGRGKFKVRRIIHDESKALSYLVSTNGSTYLEPKEEIFHSLPLALEQVFTAGALMVSYVEGDALIEFPEDYSAAFDIQKLQELAEQTLKGLAPLIKDFAVPIYLAEVEYENSSLALSAAQLCVFVVFGISIISLIYGSSILPLEWLSLTGYCLGFLLLLGVVFYKYSKSLFETGKVFALCFFGAGAVLLMLMLGVVSKEILVQPIVSKEGIIESLLEGTSSTLMRIRLASDPNHSHLISKAYLKEQPERLPQAIRMEMRLGLFNARYVSGVEVIH